LNVRSSIKVNVCKIATGVTIETCANSSVTDQIGYQVRIWKESEYPGGAILGQGLTNRDGITFYNLDAPARYVVEVTNVAGSPALTSQSVALGASSSITIGLLTP
jgi:hypothetical protein